MDELIEIFFEVLNNLSLTKGFREIRKKTESRFLRMVLYGAEALLVCLLALILAAVIFLLSKLIGLVFGLFL